MNEKEKQEKEREREEVERRKARERGAEGEIDREKRQKEAEEPKEPPPPSRRAVSFRTTHPDQFEDGFPKVYFSIWERHAPFVVKNQAEEDSVDKRFWIGLELKKPDWKKEDLEAAFKEPHKEVMVPQPMPVPTQIGG